MEPEGIEERFVSEYEIYAKDKLKKPQYQRVRIGLERSARSLVLIEGSWQGTSRHHAQKELGNLLTRLHEIENDAI